MYQNGFKLLFGFPLFNTTTYLLSHHPTLPLVLLALYGLCVFITVKLTVLIQKYNPLLNPKLPYLVLSLPLVARYYLYTDCEGWLSELQTTSEETVLI